jgi:D-alanyl-lipoteichoic acid acyltransferase DltB (MBOAT superfamily)
MAFNSLNFVGFFLLLFVLYWFVVNRQLKLQNLLLLVASYFFYACWDWRFLFLLAFSTLLDYFSGLKIEQAATQHRRKTWLVLSIGINLSFLAFFKYYNFFIAEVSSALLHAGVRVSPWTIKIILPVGISFYTFHGLSYIIDIYKKRINAVTNVVDYALFVSYFPLLVAGPIERATHLLPQLQQKRTFNYHTATEGLRQILWGLFKKVVIADGCAEYANKIFDGYTGYNGSTLFTGALFFAFQIYGDFSGYSDIALGTSKILGIDLLRNFSFPYFSRDIAEFWRRWHISLSTWFRDYVYIPLGGSRGSTWVKIRNTFVIFLLSGFWHGANWTFLAWGALNALYFLPLLITGSNRNNLHIAAAGKLLPSFRDAVNILLTFLLTVFAWIFFRSSNLQQAFQILEHIFSFSFFTLPAFVPKALMLLLLFFIVVEWWGREYHNPLQVVYLRWPLVMRWSFYMILALFIYMHSSYEKTFIYFQF